MTKQGFQNEAQMGSGTTSACSQKWYESGANIETKIEEFRGHFWVPSQDASKEAKWRPRRSKMGPKYIPKGAKWRGNGAPSEPKLEQQSMKKGGSTRICEDSQGFVGIRWDCLGFAGIRKDSLGFVRISQDSLGFPWIPSDS